MSVTIGQYEHSLDPKNRLVVPRRFRDALTEEKGSDFILTLGQDGCIGLFLPSQWERYLDRLESTDIQDKAKARQLRRAVFSSAVPAHLDEQGRILIPQQLKTHARLKKDVLITGAGNKAEIWDRARWQAYSKKAEPIFEELTQDLDL